VKRRTFIIGLDGGTFDILEPWVREGKLPGFAEIMDNGVYGELESVMPPVTAPAWASFMTGMNPGKHGVYEFLYREKSGYEKVPVNSHTIESPFLWELLGRHNIKVGVVNVPLTYPVRPVNGFLVSGLLTPRDASDYTYPEELYKQINDYLGEPYEIYTSEVYAKGRVDRVVQNYNDVLSKHIKVGKFLLSRYEPEFYMIHIFGTDRIQHELWHCMDRDHPKHDSEEGTLFGDAILDYYKTIDRDFVSPLIKKYGKDTNILFISDHGFGPLHKTIYLNTWLLKKGYIKLKKGARSFLKKCMFESGFTPAAVYKLMSALGLAGVKSSMNRGARDRLLGTLFLSFRDVDWDNTVAYAMGNKVGMIYINLKGREPSGAVNPGSDYDRVCEKLKGELMNDLETDEGTKIFDRVLSKEEVYAGSYIDRAPDLVLLNNRHEYQVMGTSDFMSKKPVENALGQSGDHRMNGLFMGMGPDFRKGERISGARIIDVAPSVLYLMGCPIPNNMDGKVLAGCFNDEFTGKNQPRYEDVKDDATGKKDNLSDEDNQSIVDRLRQLGYIG